MLTAEKLHLIEELLDVETNSLNENMLLEKISQWDSMAVIGLIAMIDDVYGKIITPQKIKKFKTIKDIMDEME